MTKSEQFIKDWHDASNSQTGKNVDYRRMIPYTTVMSMMDEYADHIANESAINLGVIDAILVAFCCNLKQNGIVFNEDYKQEDFERIANIFTTEFFNCEKSVDDSDFSVDNGIKIQYEDNKP